MKPDSGSIQSSVCAIIVTYHPGLATLENLLCAIRPQVGMTLIVDNGSSTDCIAWITAQQKENLVFLPLGNNMGVAAAHNHGIRWAGNNGFTHVILFDQDSSPFPDMVGQLLAGEEILLQRGEKVAAVGPQYCDPRLSSPAPFTRFSGLKFSRVYCKDEANEFIPADALISSGLLIRISILDTAGLMDATLFIDYVDIEWCLRVRHMGYRCFGICSAKMDHTIGDRTVSWRNGKRIIPIHGPLRNYYLIRNAILLYKRDYIPLSWMLRDAYRLLLRYAFFSLLVPPRLSNFRMMTIGLWHGITGAGGKFPGR